MTYGGRSGGVVFDAAGERVGTLRRGPRVVELVDASESVIARSRRAVENTGSGARDRVSRFFSGPRMALEACDSETVGVIDVRPKWRVGKLKSTISVDGVAVGALVGESS